MMTVYVPVLRATVLSLLIFSRTTAPHRHARPTVHPPPHRRGYGSFKLSTRPNQNVQNYFLFFYGGVPRGAYGSRERVRHGSTTTAVLDVYNFTYSITVGRRARLSTAAELDSVANKTKVKKKKIS